MAPVVWHAVAYQQSHGGVKYCFCMLLAMTLHSARCPSVHSGLSEAARHSRSTTAASSPNWALEQHLLSASMWPCITSAYLGGTLCFHCRVVRLTCGQQITRFNQSAAKIAWKALNIGTE